MFSHCSTGTPKFNFFPDVSPYDDAAPLHAYRFEILRKTSSRGRQSSAAARPRRVFVVENVILSSGVKTAVDPADFPPLTSTDFVALKLSESNDVAKQKLCRHQLRPRVTTSLCRGRGVFARRLPSAGPCARVARHVVSAACVIASTTTVDSTGGGENDKKKRFSVKPCRRVTRVRP